MAFPHRQWAENGRWNIADCVKQSYDVEGMHVGILANDLFLRANEWNSFMSRLNTIVCPGGKVDLAMQLIFTPMLWRLMERRDKALRGK